MELGQPSLVWPCVVVSGETQVLNSNSKTGVQDPRSIKESCLLSVSHWLYGSILVPFTRITFFEILSLNSMNYLGKSHILVCLSNLAHPPHPGSAIQNVSLCP